MKHSFSEEGLCPADSYGTDDADKAAETYKIATYSAIDYTQFKDCIIKKHVIIIGTALDRENWKDGILEAGENSTTDGHGTWLFDFDEITEINGLTEYYVGVNTWGGDWGFDGKYYMKYNYAPFILWAYTVEI